MGEEFVSSEEEARTELSYASARGSKYIAPPLENSIPILVPAPCHPCGLFLAAPALEEIIEEPARAICEDLDTLLREADVERLEIFKKSPLTQWYVLCLKLVQISGGGSMEFIGCIQGQAEGSSRQHALVPISKGISQDVLSSFGVQESQGEEQALHLALPWEVFFLMFPRELRRFLLSTLMELDLWLRERNSSGCLVESWTSGFTINQRIELTDIKGEVLMEAMGVYEMECIHSGD